MSTDDVHSPRPFWNEGATVEPDRSPRREIGALARRLAEYLASAAPDQGDLLAESRRFLLSRCYDVPSVESQTPRDESGASAHDEPSAQNESSRSSADRPFDRVLRRFSFSPWEKDLLVLAGMPDEHEGFAQVFSMLHPHGRPRPTSGLAAQLLCSDKERVAMREVLETGPLVGSGLLRLEGDAPFFLRDLCLAEGVWSVLMGIDRWPDRIRPFDAPLALDGLKTWLAGPASAAIRAVSCRVPCTVLVADDDLDRAFSRAAAIAHAAGVPYRQFEFPQDFNAELEQLAQIHAAARGITPVIRLGAAYGPQAARLPVFAKLDEPVVVAARQGSVELAGPRPVIGVTCERLGLSELREMWRRMLPKQAEHAALLASRYPVEPSLARQVAVDASHRAAAEGRPLEIDDVAASIRTRTGTQLPVGVKLTQPKATWGRLVLPPERKAQLREAVDRIRRQFQVLDEWRFLEDRSGARGVRVLFAGPSGVGKTLSAEAMASALQVDLLVVDLSRVVSKWIGETEKNLAEIFNCAEQRARSVLLFDEADALFGKRTEVSDAHDRYANLETAYLLSRLERFEGLTILSTNLRRNIDPAFMRRLEFIVDFDLPDRDQRLAIWKCHVPDANLLADDVDLSELATHYPLVGGLIRNAAVAAAFLAAAEDQECVAPGAEVPRHDSQRITRAHLLRAIQREYEKIGQAFPGLPAGVSQV